MNNETKNGFLDRINPHKANWNFHTDALDAETADKIESAIEYLAPESKTAVKSIESGIKTTQNNYGKYMQYLQTVVPDNNAIMLYISSSALKRAGGNTRGIVSALNILMGH